MIALVLGLLVLGAVIQMFLGSKLTYMSNEALARVQENGRFAMEMIKPDIRGVSFLGMCAGRANVTNHLNQSCDADVHTIFDLRHAVVGWEYEGTDIGDEFTISANLDPESAQVSEWTSQSTSGSDIHLPEALKGRVVPGTDVLVTRNLRQLDITVDSVQNNTRLTTVTGSEGVPAGAIIMITNCESGSDLFQQSKNQGNQDPQKPAMNCSSAGPGNLAPGSSAWGNQHDERSSVYMAELVAFYIGFNSDRDEPGLYRAVFSGSTMNADAVVHEELVEGIENMQLAYGATGSGETVDGWYSAADVEDWSLIVAIQVGLLSRSPENADMQRVSQQFDLSFSTAVGPQDARLRHAFSTTIAVRNQQIVL